MILYVNDRNQIKDVDYTTNEDLIPLEVYDEHNPFADWSVAKICCYEVKVEDGIVVWYLAYIDVDVIEHIDRVGKENEELKKAINSTQAQLDYVTMMSDIEI